MELPHSTFILLNMTRHRKLRETERPAKHKDHEMKKKRPDPNKDDYGSVLSTLAVAVFLIVLVLLGVQYWSYASIARLYTPLNEPKMVERDLTSEEANSRLWGSYRYVVLVS